MRSDKTLIRGAAALLIGVASGLASAQTLPATPASLAAADGQLETIVVTASKRSEPQQDVASQMTALTGAALDDIHATDFGGFAAFVRGLSYQSAGPTSDLIAIRGITTGGAQLSGAVGMYVDEVPVGASSSFGLAFHIARAALCKCGGREIQFTGDLGKIQSELERPRTQAAHFGGRNAERN